MPRVLISDSLAPQGLEILEHARGIEVEYAPDLSPDVLLEKIRDADGLVIRSGTKVTREVFEAATKLRVVGRAGIGVDNVDLASATERGVVVVNTPSGNNVTTAEHAIALLVALARHIPQASASMKAGKWEKNAFTGMELSGRTLGVLGLGNIGRVAAQVAQGIGMRVIAYDPHLPEDVAAKLDI
jgi:D-3-phosphoglycerate dehydrogenase